jgi:hypothetical protein
MPKVPNERGPDDEVEPKAEHGPNEGHTVGKSDIGGLAQSPRDAARGDVRVQDGPMDRPGTEAEDDRR